MFWLRNRETSFPIRTVPHCENNQVLTEAITEDDDDDVIWRSALLVAKGPKFLQAED